MIVKNPFKYDDSEVRDECVDSIVSEMDGRTRRAIEDTEEIKIAEGFFLVRTEGGSVHRVEMWPDEECECGDHEYRGVRCKHIRAVDIMLPKVEEGDKFRFLERDEAYSVTSVTDEVVEFKELLLDIEAPRHEILKAKTAGKHGDYAVETVWQDEYRDDKLELREDCVWAEGDMTENDVPHPDEAPEWLLAVIPGRQWRDGYDGMEGTIEEYTVEAVDLVTDEARVYRESLSSFLASRYWTDVEDVAEELDEDEEAYREWYDEVVGLTGQTDLKSF